MADEPPGTATVQPTLPTRRNRRRQQSDSNWRRRFWQAPGAHASAAASADPARPGRSLRDRLAALSAADVDGWAVAPENRENCRWTSPVRGYTLSEEQDYPTCLLCCEPVKVVAFGKCGHKDICAECILQMVLLYRNHACPLCKAELDQIVIVRWAGSDTGSWFEWSSILHEMWHDSWWSDYFYIANTIFPDTGQPLHAHFQQLTATACSVCDPQANHPFDTDSALCKHMVRQHHRHLCRLCLRARQRAFPLQQPTYTAPELHAHMAADHPQCCFCGPRFLDAEQYGLHMMGAHPYCELCDDDFRDAAEFTEHLRSKHWLCQEPACQGCFVAFESKEDLTFHQRTVHASVSPQQDSGEEQIMAVNVFTPLLFDLSLRTFDSDASVAALLAAVRRVTGDMQSSTGDLQSSTADLQSYTANVAASTANLQASTANLQSSTAVLQSRLQRSEHPNSSSAPDSRARVPSSALPPMPQQQQQPQANELGPSITFTLADFGLGGGEPASRTAQSSSSTADVQGRARQPQRLAAAFQLGRASGGAGSTAASRSSGTQRSRPLTQAEIDERIASRRVQPYVHRSGFLAAQPQHREVDQPAQPAHTVSDQSGQRGMEQSGQPQDTSFAAVLTRTTASGRRPAASHVPSCVRGPSQGTEPAPEPQGSQLESSGPPDLSSSASGWD